MQLPVSELDRRLAALDEAIVLLRVEYSDRDQLLAAVTSAADGILALAGDHRDYVSSRVLSIIVANGLGDG